LRKDQKDTQINYLRNSVKAVVDAYDGTVTLYQWDDKDPVLKAWMKIFPGLVKPLTDMSSAVREHVRYPQDLFNTQRALLAQYHIDDPVAAYNGRGTWAVQPDPFLSGDQPPFYVLAAPPGSTSNAAQFQLTTPMVVKNSSNLAAYMSVDSDSTTSHDGYGTITVLQVPGQDTVQGPGQVANDLKTQVTISKDITQLDSGQSSVVHGNLLTLPVGGSFLYVEPLYVQSTGGSSSFPTLARVLVRYNNKIGYGSTLDDALADLTLGRQTGSSVNIGGTSNTPPTSTSSAPPTSSSPASGTPSSGSTSTTLPTTLTGIVSQLSAAKADLDAALAKGDQVAIAQAQVKEQKLVNALLKLQSTSTSPPTKPASASPSP
jgi:uncharacterized membrane protein (UPF0182 family)